MKFNILLITLLITTMISCGTNNGNNQQESQTAQEQDDIAKVVDEAPILSLDKDNVPKSIQKMMDAQNLNAKEQKLYIERAFFLLSNSWEEMGKINNDYFEDIYMGYYLRDIDEGGNGGVIKFKVTNDAISIHFFENLEANEISITNIENFELKKNIISYNSRLFMLSDSSHLLPQFFNGSNDSNNEMEYWELNESDTYFTSDITTLYATKEGKPFGTVRPHSKLILLEDEGNKGWNKYMYIWREDDERFEGVMLWGKDVETYSLSAKSIEFGKDQLSIIGNDIWVRDAPATGKVVMKLNEGNKCTVLEKGFFEIIRGDADYWYKIEFNGQEGWVFGAQTSYKNMQTPISAATPDALYDGFKKHQKNWVDNENKGNKDEYQRYVYSENSDKFKVVWEGEGPSSSDYSLNVKSTENLCIINETARLEGAMGFRNIWSTFLGIKLGTKFKMGADRSHKFDGKVERLIMLNEGEYILFTYQDSGDEIALYQESYYNVFYINTSKNTVRIIESELGLVYRDETLYNDRNGYAILGASLEFTPNTTSFTLKEEQHNIIEAENAYPTYTPFNTLTTIYTWDAKKKTYVKE